MRESITAALTLTFVLLLAACGSEQQTAGKALPLPPLQTLVVEAPDASQGQAWDGVVQAVQQADLSAQTAGRAASIAADVNDRVKQGDELLQLTGVEQRAGTAAARAQLKSADASLAEAQANYDRFAAMVDRGYVSKAQIDQARASRDSAVAARDAARALLTEASQQTGYTSIRAPFDGIVSARHVQPGETIQPGQSLLSLYAPDATRIEVQLPQSTADALRSAPSARIHLPDGRIVDAARVIVFPSADPATHSVSVRVELPLLQSPPPPGLTARVVFPVASGSDSGAQSLIPASALVQRGELSAVYVVSSDTITLRQLRLGRRIGEQIEVLAGLSPGEVIAADPLAASQALQQRRAAVDNND